MSKLSIIIPTWNEEENLARLLRSLPKSQDNIEILIVDGCSTDLTILVAQKFGVDVKVVTASRGKQLNAGLDATSGDIIWFLHADSHVDDRHIEAIFQHLRSNRKIIGGNFSIVFDGTDPFSLWLNTFYAKIRRRGFYYGDSGIFIRRAALQEIGGIPDIPLMEDYALVRKMEKTKSQTICIHTPKIVSSSRRFKNRKKRHIVIGWIFIHCLFYLRVRRRWTARFYNSLRHSTKD